MGARVSFLAGVLVGFVLCALMFAFGATKVHDSRVSSVNISPLPGNKIQFVARDADGKIDTYKMENKGPSVAIEAKGWTMRTSFLSFDFQEPAAPSPSKSRLASFWESFVSQSSTQANK